MNKIILNRSEDASSYFTVASLMVLSIKSAKGFPMLHVFDLRKGQIET